MMILVKLILFAVLLAVNLSVFAVWFLSWFYVHGILISVALATGVAGVYWALGESTLGATIIIGIWSLFSFVVSFRLMLKMFRIDDFYNHEITKGIFQEISKSFSVFTNILVLEETSKIKNDLILMPGDNYADNLIDYTASVQAEHTAYNEHKQYLNGMRDER